MEEKSNSIPQKIVDLLNTNNDDNILLACNLIGVELLYDQIAEMVNKPNHDPKWDGIRNKVAVIYVEKELDNIVTN